jgi:archaemetzincin
VTWRLYVSPIGAVDPDLIGWIASCVADAFEVAVTTLEPVPEPRDAYDERRGQYSSVAMLQTLARSAPEDGAKVLGVTERDLFIPMLSFVLGQAQLDGRFALVSMARLRQEFYGLPPDSAVLRARARAETLHELGHAFGLIHCPDSHCAMSLSTGIAQVDRKLDGYCASCGKLAAARRNALRNYDNENPLADSRR